MITKWQKRLWLVAFFLGFNLVLGSYFLSQVRADLPQPLAQLLFDWGMRPRNANTVEDIISPQKEDPDLAVEPLVAAINKYRSSLNLDPLTHDPTLASAAAILLDVAAEAKYETDSNFKKGVLEGALKESGYTYEWVSHNALAGPKTVDAVMTAWFSDTDQLEAIESPEFQHIGLAVVVVETQLNGTIGVVIQLLGKPQTLSTTQKQTTQKQTTTTPSAVEIGDMEVVNALNAYRRTHGLYDLNVHPDLCIYAQKRADDLRAAGGLDGHAGFQADFEDPDNLPVGIRDYPKGRKIGENLAHQFCRNMTTGESFIAQTGTSLIEWCFDSSTKGHREAQLSTEFKNVCVRHADSMYVVIFGS